MKYTAVKGMHDLLPPESDLWEYVEQTARRVFQTYGFAEIRTPIVEKTPLFVRSVGQASDLVEKEMYQFVDQGDEALSLRPEGTAPVVRAYVQHGVHQKDAMAKYFYYGPYFRRERPQKGRYRQFHQIGVELFGAAHPFADAEVITLLMRFLSEVGIEESRLEMNSLGCRICRPKYQDTLQKYLADTGSQLCADCHRRMQKNPMRVFDCKQVNCQKALENAPTVQDFWCGECGDHFHQVCEALELNGIQYWANHRIARGLDYYMRTAFEVVTHDLGAQSSLCGGGRYDGLVKELGGPDVPGIGFALGVERLVMLLQAKNVAPPSGPSRFFVAALGDMARKRMSPIMEAGRRQGVRIEWDYDNRSLKAQMKRADRLHAELVVIVGDDELAKGSVVVRNMETKEQQDVPIDNVIEHLKNAS